MRLRTVRSLAKRLKPALYPILIAQTQPYVRQEGRHPIFCSDSQSCLFATTPRLHHSVARSIQPCHCAHPHQPRWKAEPYPHRKFPKPLRINSGSISVSRGMRAGCPTGSVGTAKPHLTSAIRKRLALFLAQRRRRACAGAVSWAWASVVTRRGRY